MPLVSIIVPCYNEQATIALLLEAIYCQTYPVSEMEVVIADDLSTDQTRQKIQVFQQAHPELCINLVDNGKRSIPAGLNCAIAAARGEFIIRLDAHSMPHPDYVENCLRALIDGKGENVGGVWEIRPAGAGWIARSIAAAAAHPLGVGDALYRFSEQAKSVDTVPFGAFHRSLINRIGSFDETLLTNEDYEFNVRIRRSGGTVWLDPAIRSTYFARPNMQALARQYFRYGYWKGRMLLRYPETLRWRQALPPAFIIGLIGLLALSIWFPAARLLLAGVLLLYLAVLFAASLPVALKNHDLALFFGIPLAISTMHLTWGSALLWSIVTLRKNV